MAYSNAYINSQDKAILTSIIYSDIFNFPLTRDELWNFFISNNKITKSDFNISIQRLKGKYISEIDGYFCLKNREQIIKIRNRNAPETDRKLIIAKKAAFYLSHIKSILFIGISGGLAMGDVEKEDDIDFFVITKKNTIFKSRFLILGVLQMLNLRRKRKDTDPSDKICVNFMIDEESISFTGERHDVYTAHEILQIIPLYEAQNVFKKFINSNKWVKNFFPNSNDVRKRPTNKLNQNAILSFIFYTLDAIISEKLCKSLQIPLINKHKKNETVTNHILAFNPNDYRVQTLKKMRLKLQELGLLTKDGIFFILSQN